jgi:diaminohydroxyphosphoribosylaminopyrimidine deaminase/5-amino-6-(5-phosphoribosylamino)uracil reductase
MTSQDERYMAAALRLGRRNLGQTGSNPSVATLIVKDGVIIGRGITARGGWPHAETFAFKEAGPVAQGSTAYVTMEPCAHHGKTPPCCDALIREKIGRVVIPAIDPNPLTAGKSIEKLRAAGIVITLGVCTQEAIRDHAGHALRILENRPFVQLKMAITANGIIGRKGERLIISSQEGQVFAQRLRTQCDGVLVGVGTVLADDPQLTCRLPGLKQRSPQRFVFDRSLRTPIHSKLVQTAKDVAVIIYTKSTAPAQKAIELESLGVKIKKLNTKDEDFIPAALHDMSEMGITRLLLEGGSQLAASFLRQDLIDQALIAQSSLPYEGEGAIKAFKPEHWQQIANSDAFSKTDEVNFGQDTLYTYWRNRKCLLA